MKARTPGREILPAARQIKAPRCRRWYRQQRESTTLLAPILLRNSFHILFSCNAHLFANRSCMFQQRIPLRISRAVHIPSQRLSKQFAHRPMLAIGEGLRLQQQLRRQSDRNGFSSAHIRHGKTLTNNVNVVDDTRRPARGVSAQLCSELRRARSLRRQFHAESLHHRTRRLQRRVSLRAERPVKLFPG
jgi:hypothetical protein